MTSLGFSHGATVALEMLLGGHFQGPVVLLGISLTTEDEGGFPLEPSDLRLLDVVLWTKAIAHWT